MPGYSRFAMRTCVFRSGVEISSAYPSDHHAAPSVISVRGTTPGPGRRCQTLMATPTEIAAERNASST